MATTAAQAHTDRLHSQIAELAAAIALKAEAIAAGTLVGNTAHAAALLIADNAATLVAWTTEK